MKPHRGMLGAVVIALLTGPALAANPAPVAVSPIVVVPPPSAPTTLSAYVEVFGGGMRGLHIWDQGLTEERERALGLGGAGRAAWQMSPTFGLQLDAWADHWSGRYEYCYEGDCYDEGGWDDDRMGIALHLTYGGVTGFRFGPLISAGAEDDDAWANIGLNAVYNADRFRIYIQGGYSLPLNEGDKNDEEKGYYAQFVGTFYLRPNVAISGNFGADVFREDCCDERRTALNFGGRLEFSPEGSPLAFFGAYQGRFWTWDGYEDEVNRHHYVGVGMSLLIGQDTIQGRDRAVGLVDYNGIYGQVFR